MKKKLFTLALILAFILNIVNVQAATETSHDWIHNKLADYEPYQELLQEYPNATNVMNSTSYILNEITEDGKGKIIKTDKKIFNNLIALQNYEKEIDQNNKKYKKNTGDITPSLIGSGEYVYTYFSSIKVGLTQYKYSSTRFFVACVFEWLQIPTPGIFSTCKLQGVLGLAMNPQLSIDGATYAGRISYVTDWLYGTSNMGTTSTILNTDNGGITVRPTATQGIGFQFGVPHYTGYNYEIVRSMDGVISCTAYKSNTYDTNCSVKGELEHVSPYSVITGFSVAMPAGVSINGAASSDPYPLQESLDIR